MLPLLFLFLFFRLARTRVNDDGRFLALFFIYSFRPKRQSASGLVSEPATYDRFYVGHQKEVQFWLLAAESVAVAADEHVVAQILGVFRREVLRLAYYDDPA